MKKEKFVEKSIKIHGDRYDYSLLGNNISNKEKIKIICNIHDIFEQRASNHLSDHGCRLCSRNEKLTTEKFIKKANEIHNNFYDYSKSVYINAHVKLTIICPVHGDFKQRPQEHLKGYRCSKCLNKIDCKEKFIEKAIEIHGDKYDYSLIDYKKSQNKIKILCKKHNIIFEQTPNNHISKKHNCPECGRLARRLARIKQVSEDKFNGNQVIPSYNSNGCQIFENIMKENNSYIQHAMNGGEFFIKELGYWTDGYDKENNIVYEFDEHHHFDKNGNLSQKDIRRQQEIENLLNCRFIRIKDF
jgi:hypothetical protein